jgi:hypothetical protein
VNCCTCVLTRRNLSLEFVLAAVVKGEALVARVVIGVVSTLNEGRGVATGARVSSIDLR